MGKQYSKWFTEHFPNVTEPIDLDLQQYRKKLQELKNIEFNEKVEELESQNTEKWKFQSLSSILDSINFTKAPTTRNKLYKFLKELNLCEELQFKNPSEKSIKMGYAQIRKEEPWYVWNAKAIGWKTHSDMDWYSKSYMAKLSSWKETWDLLRPNCLDDELKLPTKQAVDGGLAKLQYICEWNIGCMEEISNYFLDVYEIMKKENIDFKKAKTEADWLGTRGSFPGEEPPMVLLFDKDPQVFELTNQIQD